MRHPTIPAKDLQWQEGCAQRRKLVPEEVRRHYDFSGLRRGRPTTDSELDGGCGDDSQEKMRTTARDEEDED
ncbi:hypothetical protein Tco_0138806 [Tanacetum coccineum]